MSTDNSREPDPEGSDQQIVQIKSEYRQNDRMVGKMNYISFQYFFGHSLTSSGNGWGRWIGSHFHDWTDYNGVAFSGIFDKVTRTGSHFFGTLR